MRIGELCSYAPKSTIKAGEAVDGAKYMFFTSSADESKRYTEYQYDGEGIIMGTGGNATLHYYSGKYAVSTDCVVLVPRGNIRCKYLYYYLKANMTVLEAGFKGAGLKHTNKKYISDIDVNTVPDFCKQDEIIAILDKLNAVINSRKEELQLLEDLVSARFVEMFGDLKTNSKRWDIKSFDEISSLITDGEHATPKRDTYGIHLLSARNVLNHSLQLDDVDYINEDEYDRIAKRVVPQEGDVLISCSGTVGRCCSVPADFKFQMVRSVALIRFNKVVNPIFAEYMITSNYLQEQINSSKTSSSQANLFQGKIKALKGFLPPIELQNQFADFVKGVGKSKVAVRKALEETQLLFDSLMQQYFG